MMYLFGFLVFLMAPPRKHKIQTRKSSGAVGAPSELPEVGALYTNQDVLSALAAKAIANNGEVTKEHMEELSDEIINKYLRVNALLAVMDKTSVIQKIKRLNDQNQKLKRKYLSAKQIQNFKEKLPKLFDILICQCRIIPCISREYCQTTEQLCSGFHVICKCPKEQQIPELEIAFIRDQREKVGTLGGNIIEAGVDKKLDREYKTKKLKKQSKQRAATSVDENLKRKADEKRAERKDLENKIKEELHSVCYNVNENNDFVPESEPRKVESQKLARNFVDMAPFASEIVRFGIGKRAAAALWNGCIKSLNSGDHLKNTNSSQPIPDSLKADRMKMKRECLKFSEKEKLRRAEQLQEKPIECLGTDGKKDRHTRMLKLNIVNGEEHWKQTTGTEDHIVYTSEPEGRVYSSPFFDADYQTFFFICKILDTLFKFLNTFSSWNPKIYSARIDPVKGLI